MAVSLTDKQISYLIEHLLIEMKNAGYFIQEDIDAELQQKLARVIRNNLDEERAIEKQARDLFEAHSGKLPGVEVDRHKAFMMIKKQIAKDKGFVL